MTIVVSFECLVESSGEPFTHTKTKHQKRPSSLEKMPSSAALVLLLFVLVLQVLLPSSSLKIKTSRINPRAQLTQTQIEAFGDSSVDLKQIINEIKKEEKKGEYEDVIPIFGYTDLAEMVNGRVAMMALACGISVEILTGKSLLQQLQSSLTTPSGLALSLAMLIGITISSLSSSFSRGTWTEHVKHPITSKSEMPTHSPKNDSKLTNTKHAGVKTPLG